MNDAAFVIRSMWTDLVIDPADARFPDQLVSIPTPECPSGSTVRDDKWYYPQSVFAGLNDCDRVIDFNVPCGEGTLTDARFAGLLQVCKLFAILKMARPLRNFADVSTIKAYLVVILLSRVIKKLADVFEVEIREIPNE